jgi:hypothetical protein
MPEEDGLRVVTPSIDHDGATRMVFKESNDDVGGAFLLSRGRAGKMHFSKSSIYI